MAALGDRVGPVPPAVLDAEDNRRCSSSCRLSRRSRSTSAASFLGQKQFSIEGLDALVPMLDEAIELGAAGGAHGSSWAWPTVAA